jgi:hypothetical protein
MMKFRCEGLHVASFPKRLIDLRLLVVQKCVS